jgi:simple sugar transport system ATP-binding protein
MGDNGAGKSTLVKIIAGNFHPTQNLALSNNVSAAANVFLGRELTRPVGPFRFLDHKARNARALELFSERKLETRAKSQQTCWPTQGLRGPNGFPRTFSLGPALRDDV